MIETETVTPAQCRYIITAPGLYELQDAVKTLDINPLGDRFSGVELDFTVLAVDGTERVLSVLCTEIDWPPEPVSVEMEASIRGSVDGTAVECFFQIGGSGHITLL